MPDLSELKNLLEKQNQAFAEFKTANDERLKQIEAKGTADPTVIAKVDKANEDIGSINDQLENLEKKINRIGMGPGEESVKDAEYTKAFSSYFRKGDVQGALSTGSDADGGYAVPEELDRSIIELLRDETPMRGVANVITIGTPDYKRLVNKHGAAAAWVGETGERTETGTPSLAQIAAFMGELYANPAATQQSLDDVFFNAETWLGAEVAISFSEAENTAFTTGNGTNKPKGFLAYTTAATADSGRDFGTLEHVVTGVADNFAASDPSDILYDLIYRMRPGYLGNARFMLNRNTLAVARKWKDGQGNYLWQPSAQAGEPATLAGYPISVNPDMPDVAAASLPIAFGDFRRGYTIADRIGTRVLRDPYTNKPYVHFYTTKRVGGMVADSQAIKLIKCSA